MHAGDQAAGSKPGDTQWHSPLTQGLGCVLASEIRGQLGAITQQHKN